MEKKAYQTIICPIIRWLEVILIERFGITDLHLQQHDDFLFLTIRNQNGKIKFPAIDPIFLQGNDSLHPFFWNAATEGFKGPIQDQLVALSSTPLPLPLILKKEADHEINFDLLGFTYWMLSRREELDRTKLDHHQRFPATASLAYQYNFLDRPIIDEWLVILGQVLKRQWPTLSLKTHTFQVKVSHDVDYPSKYGFANFSRVVLGAGADIIKRRNFKRAINASLIWRNTKNKLLPSDPYNSFDWLMDVSEQQNLKSAFYFIPSNTHAKHDVDYDLGHPTIRHLLRTIHQRGHEIGLHPSYETFQNPDFLIAQAQKLKRICKEEGIEQEEWGGRMHFLRWDHPITLRAWENAGMTYDSTLGYSDFPGFRCGTCYEYPAFDPLANEALQLRIRPLISMECTILDARYLNLGLTDQAINTFLSLKENCRKVNGAFTLLWHNDRFEVPKERSIYQLIISD